MPGHGYFEELCAAATIGQATCEEVLELEQQVANCERLPAGLFRLVERGSATVRDSRPGSNGKMYKPSGSSWSTGLTLFNFACVERCSRSWSTSGSVRATHPTTPRTMS